MNRNMKQFSRQGGFSMIELSLALLVIAMLSVPIYYIYKSTSESAKVEAEITNVQGISSAIRRSWRASSDFTGLSESTLISRKQMPEKMVSGTTLMAFGGGVTVTPGSVNGGSNNAFTITYSMVPTSGCLDFLAGVSGGFSIVMVGGTTIKSTTQSYNQAAAQTSCNGAETVAVVLTGV